jgi:stage V sporulation protein AE
LKRKVILVTDGDYFAEKAVEAAAKNICGHVIFKSAGNPSPLTGEAIIRIILESEKNPVIVMVDDSGHSGLGPGEEVLLDIARHPEIDVLGVVAVASNSETEEGAEVTASVTREGKVVNRGVDKHGNPKADNKVYGDTLSILNRLDIPIVIGMGDPGKMNDQDDPAKGAPITTKAFQKILEKSGYSGTESEQDL